VRRTERGASASLTIRPRTKVIERLAAQAGWEGDAAIGRAIRMSRSATWAVLSGRDRPSLKFIAGALRALPKAQFEDLFEVVEQEEVTDVPE
jgi:hypothetical protein